MTGTMSKSRGIVAVVYGNNFDAMAAHTLSYSKKYTELPITVITNIPQEERSGYWRDEINFIYRPEPTERNRFVKTQLYKYTPYDETIYMDVDSVIQRAGIKRAFSGLQYNDILLCPYGIFAENRTLLSQYRVTYQMLKEKLPVRIFYGAFFVFKKCENTEKFFNLWHENWINSGVKREMPALSVTVKRNRELNIGEINPSEDIFSWRINSNSVVQHEYGNRKTFWSQFCKSRGLKWSTLTN